MMKHATAAMSKQIESETDKVFTLILPVENGRKKIFPGELACLKLSELGYQVLDIDKFVFGYFPLKVRVRKPAGAEDIFGIEGNGDTFRIILNEEGLKISRIEVSPSAL